MLSTSSTYQQIVASPDHYFEPKLVLGSTTYTKAQLIAAAVNNESLPESPAIGRAVASEIDVSILNPSGSVANMATMQLYTRAVSGALSLTSEWLPQGTFFVDTRKLTSNDDGLNVLTIHGYDAIMKTEADYPDTSHNWPYLDRLVVAEIASTIGVTVDSRTNGFLTSEYMVDLPIGYTMRETLEHIAAAYGGNFVMSAENKLLFVPLYGLEPVITGNYLADENGNALVFGSEGWCILV